MFLLNTVVIIIVTVIGSSIEVAQIFKWKKTIARLEKNVYLRKNSITISAVVISS